MEHVSLHSDCWSVDKQSFSLQQDHALSVQKYYTHNWAFQFLSLEERDDGIITKLEYHRSCIAITYLHLRSSTSFSFALIYYKLWIKFHLQDGIQEIMEGEKGNSVHVHTHPCGCGYHLSPLQCSHDMQNLLCSSVFFPCQYLCIFFTAPVSIRGLDGNLDILFWM